MPRPFRLAGERVGPGYIRGPHGLDPTHFIKPVVIQL